METSDVAALPISVKQIIRLAVNRVEAGQDLDDAVREVMNDRTWDAMSCAEKNQLVVAGMFGVLQGALITFLQSHRDQLLDHIEATDPASMKVLKPLIQTTAMEDVFRVFLEMEIAP